MDFHGKVIYKEDFKMKSVVQKGLLVLLLGITMFGSFYNLDGRIDGIEALFLSPVILISGFYLIAPLFVSIKTINTIDSWFDSVLLGFDFGNRDDK